MELADIRRAQPSLHQLFLLYISIALSDITAAENTDINASFSIQIANSLSSLQHQ
jgi:hypothetical protein